MSYGDAGRGFAALSPLVTECEWEVGRGLAGGRDAPRELTDPEAAFLGSASSPRCAHGLCSATFYSSLRES